MSEESRGPCPFCKLPLPNGPIYACGVFGHITDPTKIPPRRVHLEAKRMLQGLPSEMSCEDFAETVADSSYWDEPIDEAYWQRDFSTDVFFEDMKKLAASVGVRLTDTQEWDYDHWFHTLYQCTEKGLS